MPEQDQGKSQSGSKETQKLYRYVHQIAQRLDLKLQSLNDWKEVFEPESLLIRQKLRDACENLLFTANHETARKVEEYLWRKVYYDIIQRFKQDKKALMKDEALLAAYDSHLSAAIGFYNHLLMRLHQHFRIPLQGTLDWFVDCNIYSGNVYRRSFPEKSEEEEHRNWVQKACQRCLIYLGDLARYKNDVFEGPCPGLAERYYYKAVILNSSFGMPHNQLGTLRQGISFGCETVYHYMRCLLSPVAFDGAEENLKRLLEKHRMFMMQLTRDRKIDQLTPKDAFLCFFLKLQEYFCGFSSVPSDEAAQTGQQTVFAFGHILETMFQGIEKATSQPDEPVINQVLTSSCLIKLVCICMMNTYQLKAKGLPLDSIAMSVFIAIATKLIEHAVRILKFFMGDKGNDTVESTLNDASRNSPTKNNTESDLSPEKLSKEVSPEDRLSKLRKKVIRMNRRKRKRRRRRRTRTNSDEESSEEESAEHASEDAPLSSGEDTLSDLSEGELALGCLSSDEDTSSEADLSWPHDSSGSIGTTTLPQRTLSSGDMVAVASSKELLGLQELSATTHQMTKGEVKSSRSKQKILSWEAAIRELPGVEHLLEKAMEDMDFPSSLQDMCHFSVVKVVFDWIKCNYKEFDLDEEVNRPFWHATAEFLSILPPKELYIFAASHKKRMLDRLTSLSHEEADGKQRRALPEDVLVFGMGELAEVHEELDFSWNQTASHSQLNQCIVRDRCLRKFADLMTSIQKPFLKFDAEKRTYSVTDVIKPENEQSPAKVPAQSERPSMLSPNAGDTRTKSTEFMKALAKQKLEFDVSQLETTLQATKISNSNLSAYLVMETQALCRHLSLIRSLLKSGKFVVIIPKQVVSALDDLKKYNPGAREAIKFLEEEFRRGNRWLKSQDDTETISEEIVAQGRRTKSLSVEDWRFFQIVRCACYFGRQVHAECFVSILTSDHFEQNGLGPSATRLLPQALRFCQENGVQLQSAVDFYKRWTAVRK